MSIQRGHYISEDGHVVRVFCRHHVFGTIVKWNEPCGFGFIVEEETGKRHLFLRSGIVHSELETYPEVGQRVDFMAVDKVDGDRLVGREAQVVYIIDNR